MWRSKKVIIGAVLIAVLLCGSIGSAVLANETGDDTGPAARFGGIISRVCDIYNANPDRPGDIDSDILQDAFAQAHDEMAGERPAVMPRFRPMEKVWESLGYDQAEVEAAFEQARDEMEDGTLDGGPRAVMDHVLEILGISQEDIQAALEELRPDNAEMPEDGFRGRPFGPGCGFPGMPRGFGESPAPAD